MTTRKHIVNSGKEKIELIVDKFLSDKKIDVTEISISELYELGRLMYRTGYDDRGMNK